MTSANLSKQAWGEATNSAGEVRVSSYEIGVMVWPELYGEGSIMIPTFKTDTPPADLKTEKKVLVGARMPYDFPLVPYGKDEVPWVATASYTEFDVLHPSFRSGVSKLIQNYSGGARLGTWVRYSEDKELVVPFSYHRPQIASCIETANQIHPHKIYNENRKAANNTRLAKINYAIKKVV